MTDFFIIRHGESQGNSNGYFTGSIDAPLTDTGKKQSRLLAEYFENQKLDCIFSSDLSRAAETAEPIAASHGLAVQKSSALREIYGGSWEGMSFGEIEEKYPKEYGVWLNDKGNSACTNGESVASLAERVQNEFRRIAAENDGKTVVIVTHGTPIRALFCLWNGADISDMQSVDWVSNASVTRVTYENGKTEIITYNYTEHLNELVTALPKNV